MLRLIGDGGEVLRIENDNYYILSKDQEYLQGVSFEEFKKEVERFKALYLSTWNKQFKEEYEQIVDYIRKRTLTEKIFMLEDELKQLRLEGVNVENAMTILEDIIKELAVPNND